ncbi:copper homeostasis membrane protein CopD [Phyllobacterium sp. LjRoot231]|uniref:copper homeostasis membrane protein CopD n=1 Tax=Phyllobacterium sp. LjRoot231 TaxID=3342289 RepID=UPI003ECE75FD
MSPEAALIACRFLHNTSAILLWGGFAYLWMCVPEKLAGDIVQQLNPLRVVAIGIAVATTLVALPLEAGVIGNGWADALDASVIQAVLYETTVGKAWQLQVLAALLLLLAVVLPARQRPMGTAITSGLLLASLALIGHAAMHEGRQGLFHRLNDIVHVLSGGAWLGALLPLTLILKKPDASENRLALMRFSSVGHIAVALVVASGVINTLFILGHLPTDWSSPYQAMLAVKITLVGAMTALALVNRYRFVPMATMNQPHALRAIRRGTVIEIVLGVLVICLISWFGTLEPV